MLCAGEKMAPLSKKDYEREIRRLEEIIGNMGGELVLRRQRIEELEKQLREQGVEVQSFASAAIEVRSEDVEQLADYESQTKAFIEFISKIADSKSKFSKEACVLLGI